MNKRDRNYEAGYHWGIKGKALGQDQVMLDQEWYVGYEDAKADYERIRDEGTLEEQLEASLNPTYNEGMEDSLNK